MIRAIFTLFGNADIPILANQNAIFNGIMGEFFVY